MLRAVRPRRIHRGQTAVEIAIAAPILSVLLIICSDFARIFYTSVEVNNAARAGAQYASQTTSTASNTSNIALAAEAGAPNLSLTSSNVTSSECTCVSPAPSGMTECASNYCTDSGGDSSNGNIGATYVTVTVTKAFNSTFNLASFSNVIHGFGSQPSSWTLTGSAIVQVSQ